MSEYLLTSERLGFRNWTEADKPLYAAMNQDPQVMEYFPSMPTPEETYAGVDRYIDHINTHNFGYFAVDLLSTGTFIGFIGILNQTYESAYTPFVDIGWRLAREYWGKGYATEGAIACLDYGFNKIGLEEIFATTTWNNTPSQKVALKIGMEKIDTYTHPRFAADHYLQPTWLFRKKKS